MKVVFTASLGKVGDAITEEIDISEILGEEAIKNSCPKKLEDYVDMMYRDWLYEKTFQWSYWETVD